LRLCQEELDFLHVSGAATQQTPYLCALALVTPTSHCYEYLRAQPLNE
jgi:hypothetical protein